MGALRQKFLVKNQLSYRLFTSPWLHAGALHLLINLSSIILVGIYMEQEFGPSNSITLTILSLNFLIIYIKPLSLDWSIYILALLFACAVRIGMIYVLSAFTGSLFAALFVQNSPAVCSSGGLFGLIGAMLSGLLRNWELYSNKVPHLLFFFYSNLSFSHC